LPSSADRVVLVRHSGTSDPETGGNYTVFVWRAIAVVCIRLWMARKMIVAGPFYSPIETAKLHDIDPAEYLREAARASARGEALLLCQLRD
jgi:hypothetical protein